MIKSDIYGCKSYAIFCNWIKNSLH